jgi:hypothetical protein
MACRDLRMIAPLVFAWVGAVLCCASPAPAAEPGFIDVVTDSSLVYTIPTTARPAYLAPTLDPTFRLPVVRITGNTGTNFPLLDGTTGTWGGEVRHHYSKTQPWSADGALLMIENAASSGGIPTRVILDGETYQPLWGRCSYLLDDARWHPTLEHARELIGVRETADSLVWFDPITCNLTRGWKLPLKPLRIGMSEGNASHDGRYIAMANAPRW